MLTAAVIVLTIVLIIMGLALLGRADQRRELERAKDRVGELLVATGTAQAVLAGLLDDPELPNRHRVAMDDLRAALARAERNKELSR